MSLDPADMAPDERFRELAAILARAVLRLGSPHISACGPEHPVPDKVSQSSQKPLAGRPDQSAHGPSR